jgi:hypothetical protein
MKAALILVVVILLALAGWWLWSSGQLSGLGAAPPPAPASDPAPAPGAATGPTLPTDDGGKEVPKTDPLPAVSAADTPPPADSGTPAPSSDAGPGFSFLAPMDLIPSSGPGYTDSVLWAPDICFPLEEVGYANSQIYRPGGMYYPQNQNQCDPSNYSFPWRDDFCEVRSGVNVFCPGGLGHQGQDIRPASCVLAKQSIATGKNQHWTVAADNGKVTSVASYSVEITGTTSPHRLYRYLHMESSTVKVHVGDTVAKGDRLGIVSNNMGFDSNGKPEYTSLHMHFEIRVPLAETAPGGQVLAAKAFVPPYTSLVGAYQRRVSGNGCPAQH